MTDARDGSSEDVDMERFFKVLKAVSGLRELGISDEALAPIEAWMRERWPHAVD